MKIALLTTQVPFIYGGGEILADSLFAAIREAGHTVDMVRIPFKWYPPEKILDHMLACRLLDLSESCGTPIDRVIGLRFPAYLAPHPNKVMWLVHQHRSAYDLWENPADTIAHFPNGQMVRDSIHAADRNLIPEHKEIYTISANVSKRLKHFCGIDSTPLYHPPRNATQFHCKPAEKFLFFPSRLTPLKRQELVLDALAKTKQDVHLVFAGSADSPEYGQMLQKKAEELGLSKRVTWRGHISEEDKLALYATCSAVVFTPVDEDYGYITLEAMLASKAVLTCVDSGGSLEFIEDGLSGKVVEPEAQALAEAMDILWDRPEDTAKLGRNALEVYKSMNITWQGVLDRLLA